MAELELLSLRTKPRSRSRKRKAKMLEDLPSIARSSEKVVKNYLENLYHAARKIFWSISNQLSSQMYATVPTWEAAKQRLEEHRDAVNGDISRVRECHQISSQKARKSCRNPPLAIQGSRRSRA
jgi:hypothetical protein